MRQSGASEIRMKQLMGSKEKQKIVHKKEREQMGHKKKGEYKRNSND